MNDPIDPAIVEMAKRALRDAELASEYRMGLFIEDQTLADDAIAVVVSAVADDLRAEAKAEVLREAASGPIPRLALAGNTRAWLRARADQIEHAPRCPHLKCPGGSLCCCADALEAGQS